MYKALAASIFAITLALLIPSVSSAQGACPSGLSRGMQGPRVTELQQFLFNQYANFPQPTGFFGPVTENAVKQWQSDNGIVSSGTPETTGWGVAGPKTLTAMGLCPGGGGTGYAQGSYGGSGGTTGGQASCTFNNLTIPHGAYITRYEAFSVPAGQVCRSEQRTCSNGFLSGGFIYPSCTVQSSGTTGTGSGGSSDSTPRLSISPTSGPGPLRVTINYPSEYAAAINTDCENVRTSPFTGRTFSVDWGDGSSKFDRANKCNPHTFTKKGEYRVTLRVFDLSNGNPASDGGTTVFSASATTTVTGGTITTSCLALTRDLKPGDSDSTTGGEVTKLQEFLAQDSSIYPEGLVTGFYGPATQRAVERWQIAHGIVSSGTPETTGFGAVGPKTRASFTKDCPKPASFTITAKPAIGAPPLAVAFTISAPYGTYTLDLGNGATQQVTMPILECSGTSCGNASTTVQYTYTTAGTFTAALKSGATLHTSTKVTVASCAAPDRDLKVGDEDANTGNQVTVLQQFLARDTSIYPEGLVTGYYGNATREAVVRFQKRHGISQTGTVGPLTRTAMADVCAGKTPTIPKDPVFASPTSGKAPLEVAFTAANLSRASGLGYVIDFGDGERATLTVESDGAASAKHTYTKAGTFVARLLEVEYLCGGSPGGHGCDRELQINSATITVDQKIDDGGLTPGCGKFEAGSVLKRGEFWKSCNQRFWLAHQAGDGHIVLYDMGSPTQMLHRPIWFNGITGQATDGLAMQGDGNLVLYRDLVAGGAIWHTFTFGNPGAYLLIEDGGNMLIKSPNGTILWQTFSGQGGGGGGGDGGDGGGGTSLGCIDTFGDSTSSLQTCFDLSGRTLSLRQIASTNSSPININVVWGDGVQENWFGTIPARHIYASGGTYIVTLTWTFRDFSTGTNVVRTATKHITI